MCVWLVAFAAPPAAGYAIDGRRWTYSYAGTYCYFPAIYTNGWQNFIQEDVAQYNALRNPGAGYYGPSWSLNCNGTNAIDFNVVPLGSLCGLARYVNQPGSIYLDAIHIEYNTNKTYGGRNGAAGQCHFDRTTLHEFGHSQGLSHSCSSSTIMYKYTSPPLSSLQSDDKIGHRVVYDPSYSPPYAPQECP